MSKFSEESNAKYAEAREYAKSKLNGVALNYTEIRDKLGVTITAKELGGFEPSIKVEGWAFFDAEDAAKVADTILNEVKARRDRLFGRT